MKEKIVLSKSSDGFSTASVHDELLVYKDNKVYLDDQEISTYEDAKFTQAHLSPDKLKLLLIDEKKLTMQIIYLKNLRKLKERS